MTETLLKPQSLQQIIVCATSFHYGIETDFLRTNKSQDRNSTFQRFICFFLLKKMTLLSNREIGCLFDLKETAVRNGIAQVESFTDINDKRTITDIKQIEVIIDNFSQKKIDDLKNQ
jgi:chromosomal replication initiation ATPase DnaA